MSWNPGLYQESHSFVWQLGQDLLPMLAPQPGERILDLGCGTGQLTAEIARSGARVLGVDSSEEMIAQARSNFPDLGFEVADATALSYREEFDAVFSNAALHWVKDAEAAVRSIARALKTGGRFVAEFGGRGNVRSVIEAAFSALASFGVRPRPDLNPWYFPSVGEYASLLERHGLAVSFAALFDRPTRLEGGREALANWFEMFGSAFTALAPRDELLRRIEERAAAQLLDGDVWTVDYRRLRVAAVREG